MRNRSCNEYFLLETASRAKLSQPGIHTQNLCSQVGRLFNLAKHEALAEHLKIFRSCLNWEFRSIMLSHRSSGPIESFWGGSMRLRPIFVLVLVVFVAVASAANKL